MNTKVITIRVISDLLSVRCCTLVFIRLLELLTRSSLQQTAKCLVTTAGTESNPITTPFQELKLTQRKPCWQPPQSQVTSAAGYGVNLNNRLSEPGNHLKLSTHIPRQEYPLWITTFLLHVCMIMVRKNYKCSGWAALAAYCVHNHVSKHDSCRLISTYWADAAAYKLEGQRYVCKYIHKQRQQPLTRSEICYTHMYSQFVPWLAYLRSML